MPFSFKPTQPKLTSPGITPCRVRWLQVAICAVLAWSWLRGEPEELAVAVYESQRLAGAQAVQPRLQARKAAQRSEIGEVQLQASENVVEGIVTAHDHVDGGEPERSVLERLP